MTTTSTLPSPLSAPPTVATLQELLDGLHQPMHRGVPSPPTSRPLPEVPTDPAVPHATSPTPSTPPVSAALGEDSVLDLTRLEQSTATSHAVAPPPVSLTWSAGRAHSHPRRTAAVAVAGAAVVALAAFAATTGEFGLP